MGFLSRASASSASRRCGVAGVRPAAARRSRLPQGRDPKRTDARGVGRLRRPWAPTVCGRGSRRVRRRSRRRQRADRRRPGFAKTPARRRRRRLGQRASGVGPASEAARLRRAGQASAAALLASCVGAELESRIGRMRSADRDVVGSAVASGVASRARRQGRWPLRGLGAACMGVPGIGVVGTDRARVG